MTSSTGTKPFLAAALSAGVAAGALIASSGAWSQASNVGVTAAVNVDARGRPPGAAPRVLALGNTVVYDEEITTDATGLAQILLLDGTTFTVGPNSRLTIDEFVYNPNTGDARVVATLTRGAFRFVGARTSQAPGGAVVRTPVGTIGIRGAAANVAASGSDATISLLAGNCVSLGGNCIVYKPGYTAEIGADGVDVHKTTKEEAQAFQQLVSGKPGTSGGTDNPPDESNVPQSLLPDEMMVPGSPNPVESTPPDKVEEDVADIGGATQDQINEDIAEGGGEEPPPPATRAARVLTAPPLYSRDGIGEIPAAGGRGLVGTTPELDQELLFAREEGRLVAGEGTISLPDFTGAEGDVGGLAALAVTDGTSALGPVSGTAYAGVGDFVAYMLGVNGDPAQPYYVIYGTPTDEAALAGLRTGSSIREYSLTPDPIRSSALPFFANDQYSVGAGSNAGNLIVIEFGQLRAATRTHLPVLDQHRGQRSFAAQRGSALQRRHLYRRSRRRCHDGCPSRHVSHGSRGGSDQHARRHRHRCRSR